MTLVLGLGWGSLSAPAALSTLQRPPRKHIPLPSSHFSLELFLIIRDLNLDVKLGGFLGHPIHTSLIILSFFNV